MTKETSQSFIAAANVKFTLESEAGSRTPRYGSVEPWIFAPALNTLLKIGVLDATSEVAM